MNRPLLSILIAALLLLTSSACDGGGSGDNNDDIPSQPATFQAAITGDVELDVSGTAFSGITTKWGLALTVTSAKNAGYSAITFLNNGEGRPGEGSFSVGGVGSTAGDFYASATINNENFTATSGSFVVTSSTDTNVRGTFSVTAAGRTVANPVVITVTGGFNATNHVTTSHQ